MDKKKEPQIPEPGSTQTHEVPLLGIELTVKEKELK